MELDRSPSLVGDLVSRVRQAGISLRVEGSRLRFKAPPGALTDDFRAALRAERDNVITYLRAEAERTRVEVPVSPNQVGMWFLQRLVPSSAAYNVTFAVRLHGKVDMDVLRESLQTLVDRHESLRTTFPARDGAPVRLIHGYRPFELTISDASGRGERALEEALRTSYNLPFDLENGPVIRAVLFREGSDSSVLQVVAHHIAVDGTSIFVLLEELLETYAALTGAQPAVATEPAATYSEFVEWQLGNLEHASAASAYWQQVLTPAPPALDLPADAPRTRMSAMVGGTLYSTLGAELTTALRDRARSLGVTEYVLLLSLWFVFLHRFTNQSDITVGTPVHGRPSARFARTIGDFVNTLPIRLRDIAQLDFTSLVGRVKEVVIQGLAQQDYPLAKMIESQSAGAGAAPFQTAFILQDFSRFRQVEGILFRNERVRFGPLDVTVVPVSQQEGQFELSLDVWPSDDSMLCTWRYDSALFDRATVEGWAGTFESLVKSMLAEPNHSVASIPVLSSEDRRLLDSWNDNAADYPDQSIHAAIEAQAANTPDAIAISAADGAYTYGQLIRRAKAISDALRSRGVQHGDRVGIMLPRGRDIVASMLGVLGSGACYVPLDPSYPDERLRHMVSDSGAAAVITTRDLEGRFDGSAALVDIADCAESSSASFTTVDPAGTAYVIYTSGSTGLPKGVAVPHRAVVNFLTAMAREPGLASGDTLLAVTTISFDIAGLELYLPLTVGARIVLAAEADVIDGRRLARIIESEHITHLQATPATWKLLIESGWSGCETLVAMCGGEALTQSLAGALVPRVGALWNLYGPTETTIWSTVQRIDASIPVLIGKPIANTTVYVLDQNGQRTPIGVPGELWIGGAGVARGYLNRPELTAERFVESPFRENERIYRTGDLARFRRDGRLQHLGRLDHQVKVRGYRIELGEIEARMRQHEDVHDAVAVARDDRIIGYFVPSGEDVSSDELRAFLRRTLPEYMVPGIFVSLSAMPLTPNGKIDRGALPAPRALASARSTPHRAPDTGVERALAAIWAEVLERDDIGIDDNFFELGGHSLAAARVAARIVAGFGVELPLRTFFERPTISGIATWLTAIGHTTARSDIERLNLSEAQASFAQERLWFLQQLTPQSVAYNLSIALLVEGEIDISRLQNAVDRVVARHESLRTTLHLSGDSVVQRIHPEMRCNLLVEDIAEQEGTALQTARSFVSKYMERPYELDRGPLLRVAIARMEDGSHVLALGMHHVISDQWSLGILLREISAFYDGADRQESLPELSVQYSDFAVWQRARAESAEMMDHVLFWREQLRDIQPLHLPTDHPRPRARTTAGAVETLRLPAAVASSIDQVSRHIGVTPFVLTLAAYNVALRAFCGQSDIIVGAPIATRPHPAFEDLIGSFLNVLVYRTDVSGNVTFREVVHRVRETALDAAAHQDVPFELLARSIDIARDTSRPPLVQVLFNVANTPVSAHLFGDRRVTPLLLERSAAQFDLSLHIHNDTLYLEYSTDLFIATTVQRILGIFATVLERVLENPDVPLQALVGDVPDVGRITAPSVEPRVHESASRTPPRSGTESRLAAIWSQVLGVPVVAVEDSFFDLGGHSLLAARILATVRDEFGVDIPMAAIFDHPRLGAFAARIDATQPEAAPAQAAGIESFDF